LAKVSAPLLSFGASGSIADTQTYSSWKGRKYARQKVTPSNPQTAEQTLTRNTFSWLQAVYKLMPALAIAPWDAYAVGKVLTGRNAFTKFNNAALRTETDLALLTLSPGALGGLPPTAVVATPGNNQLSVAITAPSVVPSGWTIDGAVAAAIVDQDPQSDVDYTITVDEDLTSTYTVVLTGLLEVPYVGQAWLRWLRPDGRFAYSPGVAFSGTPT